VDVLPGMFEYRLVKFAHRNLQKSRFQVSICSRGREIKKRSIAIDTVRQRQLLTQKFSRRCWRALTYSQ
jgi:hypothetical protein